MRAVCVTLLATCAAGMGLDVTAASAATVTVTLDAQFHSFNEVRYVAAPGETNDLTAHYAADAQRHRHRSGRGDHRDGLVHVAFDAFGRLHRA